MVINLWDMFDAFSMVLCVVAFLWYQGGTKMVYQDGTRYRWYHQAPRSQGIKLIGKFYLVKSVLCMFSRLKSVGGSCLNWHTGTPGTGVSRKGMLKKVPQHSKYNI